MHMWCDSTASFAKDCTQHMEHFEDYLEDYADARYVVHEDTYLVLGHIRSRMRTHLWQHEDTYLARTLDMWQHKAISRVQTYANARYVALCC